MNSEMNFPPRGSGNAAQLETPPSQVWAHPTQLGPRWDWKAGRVLLGSWQGRMIGIEDDRHVVTVAGNRAGKSSSVLIPNLLRYPQRRHNHEVFDYIEGFYNPTRRHSHLGLLSPLAFEQLLTGS